jgi:hypothetical protein
MGQGSDAFIHCRLNWQLHFGEAPKWSEGVNFILVDVEPSPRDAQKAALVLTGDAGIVARQLQDSLPSLHVGPWRRQLGEKVPPCWPHYGYCSHFKCVLTKARLSAASLSHNIEFAGIETEL